MVRGFYWNMERMSHLLTSTSGLLRISNTGWVWTTGGRCKSRKISEEELQGTNTVSITQNVILNTKWPQLTAFFFALRNFSSDTLHQICYFPWRKIWNIITQKWIKDQSMLRRELVFNQRAVCVLLGRRVSLHCRQTVKKPVSKDRANFTG